MLTVDVVLSEEIDTTMRLIGVTSLDGLNSSFVNTKRLELELVDRLQILPQRPQISSKL